MAKTTSADDLVTVTLPADANAQASRTGERLLGFDADGEPLTENFDENVEAALAANHDMLVALRARGENIPASPAWLSALEERRHLRARAEAAR